MKTKQLKSVSFNNRKKQLCITYKSGDKVAVHYGELGIHKNITKAWIDKETKDKSIGFEFVDGSKNYMPYDQPFFASRDPAFLLQTQIEIVIAKIKEELTRQRLSKHYLAEKLHTSDNQIQRLLNPSILNKNLEQLYKVADLLGLVFELKLSRAA